MTRKRRERLRAALKRAMVEFEEAMDSCELGTRLLNQAVAEKLSALQATYWPELTRRDYETMLMEVREERQARRNLNETTDESGDR